MDLSVCSELFGATKPFPTFFTSLYFMYFDVPFQILPCIKFLFANNTDGFNVLLHVCCPSAHMLPFDVLLKIVFVHCWVVTRAALMHWNYVCHMFVCVVFFKFNVFLEFLLANITFKRRWSQCDVTEIAQKYTLMCQICFGLCNFCSFAASCLSNLYLHMVTILGKGRRSVNNATKSLNARPGCRATW